MPAFHSFYPPISTPASSKAGSSASSKASHRSSSKSLAGGRASSKSHRSSRSQASRSSMAGKKKSASKRRGTRAKLAQQRNQEKLKRAAKRSSSTDKKVEHGGAGKQAASSPAVGDECPSSIGSASPSQAAVDPATESQASPPPSFQERDSLDSSSASPLPALNEDSPGRTEPDAPCSLDSACGSPRTESSSTATEESLELVSSLVYRVLVDTGAARSAINRSIQERLGLPIVGRLEVKVANGEVDRRLTVMVGIEVETGRQFDLEVSVRDRPPLLGMDFVREAKLCIAFS